MVGLAYVYGMCRGWKYGATVVSGGSRPLVYVAATLSHELGHALGMNHDNSQSVTKIRVRCKCILLCSELLVS